MKKKIVLFSLIFAMSLATTACGNSKQIQETTAPVTTVHINDWDKPVSRTESYTKIEETTEEESELETAEPETEPEPETEKPTEKPTEEKTEAPTEIVITSVTSSVNPGETASVSIQGAPNTEYSITVTYKSGKSKADGLETKTSDDNGNVSWSWEVGAKTSSGTYPIKISGGGARTQTEFTVN